MVLTTLDLRGKGTHVREFLPTPADPGADVADAVAAIIAEVRARGDDAIADLTERFDGVRLASSMVDSAQIAAAVERVPSDLLAALERAWTSILAYHADEAPSPAAFHGEGLVVQHRDVPVERAGCYAPGGRARYPSSVLMCAAPARVAGVREIILCTPPAADGRIDDATLAAAHVAGITAVYAVGGAQAIAAMAIGTDTIERVDVIVGPGNSYVAESKRQLSGLVGIASAFAGPSEIVVIADASTPADLAAVDLMVQAEHGPDGMAWLITWVPEIVPAIEESLTELMASAPRRADLEATMASSGVACLVDSPAAAMAVSNIVAPEHLELLVTEYAPLVEMISAAGAVFCGLDAPASLGDYASGPNHILPTTRSARFSSALRADDFRRHIHVVEVDRAGFEALADTVIVLAEAEGLDAHAESIRRRR